MRTTGATRGGEPAAKVLRLVRGGRVDQRRRRRLVLQCLASAESWTRAGLHGEVTLTEAVVGAAAALRRAELEIVRYELDERAS